MDSTQEIRFKDHFPSVLPECKEYAARFFFCFTQNSEQEKEGVKKNI